MEKSYPKRIGLILLASQCILLNACAHDPYAGVPSPKRAEIIAEAMKAQQENDTGPLTVAELIEQYQDSSEKLAQQQGEAQKPMELQNLAEMQQQVEAQKVAKEYRDTFTFSKEEIKLNSQQADILYNLLKQLENPKQYTAKVDIGPGTDESEFNAAIISKQRARSFDIALEQILASVETNYNPKLPVGTAIVELEPMDKKHV